MAEWGTKMGAEMEREKADGDGGVKAIAASGGLGGDAQVMALAGGMKAAAKAERGVGGGPRCEERGAAAAEAEVGLAECEDL